MPTENYLQCSSRSKTGFAFTSSILLGMLGVGANSSHLCDTRRCGMARVELTPSVGRCAYQQCVVPTARAIPRLLFPLLSFLYHLCSIRRQPDMPFLGVGVTKRVWIIGNLLGSQVNLGKTFMTSRPSDSPQQHFSVDRCVWCCPR